MVDHPLTHATVTINGETYGPRSIIWAGLDWRRGEVWNGNDMRLNVPWCHPDDEPEMVEMIYGVRPRDPRRRFVRGRSGVWVLRMADA